MNDEVKKLLEENEKLKNENNYLKRLLKENNINYVVVDQKANIEYSKEEKIDIYSSYFKSREDIFAVKYLDKKENKKKYVPVCQNSFGINCDKIKYPKCKGCPYKKYTGISRSNLIEHFTGKKSYGVYPLLDGDECYFLAVDFDDGDFFNSALIFKNMCKKYDIDCAIEMSQSGLGAHVWMFFEEKIKAKIARKIGDFILNKAFLNSKNISFSSFDRFFPSQDYLEKEGYGNLIALPLDGKLVIEGKTVFIDDNKLPYENQIAFLNSIKKINTNELEVILEKIKTENEIDILPRNISSNLDLSSNDFLKVLNIYINKDIDIFKNEISTKVLKYLMRLGSVINNEYYEKERMRQSTYNIPRILQLFKEDDSCIQLPRGCLNDLIKILDTINVSYEIIDNRNEGQNLDVEFIGELREEQEVALSNILTKNNGVFVAPTGFGKTVLSAALISELKKNTLILVNNINLIEQWREKLGEFLDIEYDYKKDKFGVYYGAKKKLTFNIDIASIHSFDDSKESYDILSKYGLILIDEVHHLAARTFERVLRNTNTKYIYGLTATPKRFDKQEKIIYKTIGDIIYEHKENNIKLNKVLIPKLTHFRLSTNDKIFSYAEQCNKLAYDEERNKQIIDDIKECLLLKKNIILLSDRVEHLKILHEEIKAFSNNVYFITGQMKNVEKKVVIEQLKNIREDGYLILATGKYVGEGFDFPSLDTLFLTMPFKWEGMLAQYVGRLHRITNNKKEVTVYDYVDLKVPMFSRMFNKRLKAYKKHKYEINKDILCKDTILFDNSNYCSKLIEDIKDSKEVIFIINSYESDILHKLLLESQHLKVRIISNINYSEINLDVSQFSIKEIYTTINAIIIDNQFIWYGEINPFAPNLYENSIMRINDKTYAKELVDEIVGK